MRGRGSEQDKHDRHWGFRRGAVIARLAASPVAAAVIVATTLATLAASNAEGFNAAGGFVVPGVGSRHHPVTPAPAQRWGSAAGQAHVVDGPTNHTLPASLRGQYPVRPAVAAPKAPPNPAHVAAAPPAPGGFDPKTSVEVPDARSANSRGYANADGTQTTAYSAAPLNVRGPDGTWTPVDPTVVAAPGGGWRSRAGPVDARAAARATGPEVLRIGYDAEHVFGFGVEGATGAAGHPSGATVTYPDALPGTDLRFDFGGGAVEQTLVLHASDSPHVYRFPLELKGLRAVAQGNAVSLVDAAGRVRSVLPAGTMSDSATTPARSAGVRYTVDTSGGLPVLVVTLDAAWLTDPARRYPVRVDPTVDWSAADSSMVVRGNSSSVNTTELLAGDQNGTPSASYLKFGGLATSLANQTIYGAQLQVAGFDAASCTPRPLGVYPVTQSWTAGSGYTYPGPSVGAALTSSSFAYGYIAVGQSRSACPASAVLFDLGTRGRDLVQGWVDGQPNNGLSLRASATDPLSWKGLAGTGTANPPTLYVTHSPYNAAYAIPNPVPNPPVLQNQAGKVNVTVTNRSAQAWTPAGYYLAYRAFDAHTDKLVAQQRAANLPGTVARNGKVTLAATIGALPPGTYFLDFTMVRVGGPVFTDDLVPPARLVIQVFDIAPVVQELFPDNGYATPTLTPQLWARAVDIDAPPGSTLRFSFDVCEHTDAGTNVNCVSSGDLTTQAWTVPAGTLSWSRTYQWRATVKDANNSVPSDWVTLLTSVPQPEITSRVADAPYGSGGQEYDPQVGNFTTSAVDAPVATVGPAPTVTRTYNSLDPRRDLAFGAGWTTQYDMRLAPDNDGSGNVVVTYADGEQVRYGRNPDGTFAAPDGRVATLSVTGGGYTLADRGGTSYTFSGPGQLTRITDAGLRSLVLTYDQNTGRLSRATVSNGQNNTNGRSLRFTWSNGHVATVSTDPVNGAVLTWTYTYSGDLLTTVCDPLGGCTNYTYASGSHYRSAVLDARPESYYRLGETGGAGVTDTAAGSEVAVNLGKDAATYQNATLAAPGALAGSPDTAVTFNGTSTKIDLPKGLLKQSRDGAIELWFKMSPVQTGGPLIGYQNQPLSGTPTSGQPLVYVGTDGLLRGQYATGSAAPITSAVTVNTNTWHHVVLSVLGSTQTLYLDGNRVGTLPAGPDQNLLTSGQIGAAFTGTPGSWPFWGSATKRYFSGSIDEVAVYAHPLGPAVVAAHHTYGVQAADQLTQVTLPSGRVAAAATYDVGLDRVKEYTDSNGGTWKIGAPAVYGGGTDLRRSVQVLDPAGRPYLYEYDALAGRLLRTGVPLGLSTRDEDRPGYPSPSPSPSPNPTPTCSQPDPGDPQFCTILPGDNTDPIFVRQPLDGLAIRTFQYDGHGFQNLITNENGDTVSLGYTARGNVTSRTTCREATECHTVYSTFPATVTNPLDPRDDLPLETRDGRSASATDNTYRTSYTYTATGDLATQTNPDGGIVRNTYTTGTEAATGGGTEPPALLASAQDPRGAVTSYAYFANGDLASVTDPSGLRTSFTYDALGRKVSETDVSDSYPAGVSTTYAYDALSRLIATTGPATTDAVNGDRHQAETDQSYDQDGNLATTAQRDPLGGDPSRVTAYTYDDHGHVAQVTDPQGGVTAYGYDAFGNRTSMVDANGDQYQYAYTARNQLAEVRLRDWNGDPAGTPSPGGYLVLNAYAYDFGGRLALHTDAMGRQVRYDYYDDDLQKSVTLTNFHDAGGKTREYGIEADSYDGAGNPTREVASDGARVVTHTVTPTGQVASTTVDPTGLARRTTFTYDLAGNVTSTTQSGAASNVPWATPSTSSTVSYAYDLAGNAVTETANAGGTTTAVTTSRYDQRGLLVAQTDPRGNAAGADPAAFTTTYRYDEAGRPVSVTGPAVSAEQNGGPARSAHPTETTGYDTFGEPVAERDALGNVTRTGYDAMGRPVTRSSPAYLAPGSTTAVTPTAQTRYDGVGNVVASTDPRGHTTRYTYDRLNRVTTRDEPGSTDSERAVWHYTYLRTGDVLSVTDPTGAQASSTYDDLDRQVTATQAERYPTPDTFTTRYTYDAAGNPLTTVTPSGATTSLAYDPLGELTSATDPSGVVTRYGYDFAGRQVRVSDGLGRTVRTDYDALGRQSATTSVSPSGAALRSVTYDHDLAGNVTGATDPTGATTTYAYDALGNLASQTEPVSAGHSITTSFGYDVAGDRTRYTDGRGNSTLYTVNSLGLPESVVQPATTAQPAAADRTWTVAYDQGGNPARLTAPGGITRERNYDAAGRLTSETGAGGSTPAASRTLGYDIAGRVTSVNAPGGSDAFTYDDRGDLLSSAGPSGAATFGYDGDGNLTSRTDAAGTSRYGYTKDRLTTVADGITGTTQTMGYDAAGETSSVDFGAGRVRGYGYDALGRLTSDTLRNSAGATVSSITYGYDVNDQITEKDTTGTAGAGANSYGYDQSGRLTSWTAGGTVTPYAWDDSGNRTRAGTRTASFDERDRVLADGGDTYAYTARGTLAVRTGAGNTEAFSFDAFDRMVGDGRQTYAYDGLDRPVTRNGAAAFAYDGTGADPVTDGAQDFARGPDGGLLAVGATSGPADLTLADQHDDVVGGFPAADATLSSLGTSAAYDPFGNVLATAGDDRADLGYQGDWTDPATGAVDMGARWYDPSGGRFDSPDPQSYTSGDSVLANQYAYGADAPLSNTDPDGNWPHCGWCSAAGHAVAHGVSTGWHYVSQVPHYISEGAQIGWHYLSSGFSYAANLGWSAIRDAYSFAAHLGVTLYHAGRSGLRTVANLAGSGVRALGHGITVGVTWTRQEAGKARQVAAAAARRVTAVAKQGVRYAIQHSPLPALVAATKTVVAGAKHVGSALAHLPAEVVSVVRSGVKDAAKTVGVVYRAAVDKAGTVLHDVSAAAQAALPTVLSIAAGVLTTAGCLALTGGAGSGACVAAGFAASGAVSSAFNCPPGRSIAGCAARGGAAGLVAGAVFVGSGGSAGGLSAAILAGGLSSAAGSAVGQYLDTGHVDGSAVAQSAVTGAAVAGLTHGLGGEGGAPASDEPVLFGQKRVSPDFSEGGNFHDRPIRSVADDLISRKLSPDDLPLNVFRHAGSGALVTENNRSLTALSMAGMRPTILNMIVPPAKVLARLEEVGPLGDRLPATRIAITPSQEDLRILDIVNLPGF